MLRTASFVASLLLFAIPTLALAGSQSYTTPGTQTFTVPAGITSLNIQLKGAGGGTACHYYGSSPSSPGSPGGSGGSTQGTLAVTPGQTLSVMVGGSGSAIACSDAGSPNRAPGGFGGGGESQNGGSGGGRSAIQLNGTEIMTAGGGGGGGATGLVNGHWWCTTGGGPGDCPGGSGGGITGGNGTVAGQSYPTTGNGGTQTGPGICPTVSSISGHGHNGGDTYYSSGGGGGGWYGGSGSCHYGVGGGGGGSGHCDASLSSCATTQGGGAPSDTNGSATISWTGGTPPPSPQGLSCNITFDQNPISTGDTTTIHWSSAGTPDAFYLRSIGWVGASGSTRVGPSVTTDYSGTVYKCPAGTTLNATHDSCVGGSGGGGSGGSKTYSTPGSYTFTVPANYGTLTVTVNGAGGGSGNYDGYGIDGGNSSFNGTIIGRGGGGSRGTTGRGAPGTASGGNVSNTTGGGAAGGDNGYVSGGNGGQAVSTYATGALPSTATVVVGAGGPGDPFYGGPGQNGSVQITWTGGGGGGGGTPPQTAECSAQLTVGESCPPGQRWDETTRSCVVGGGPGAPVVTAAGACVVNEAQTYTLRSVDSDAAATLRYGLDWDRNGVIDQWVPSTGYVLQGTARTVAHVWTTAGTHTFQALAEDNAGRRSGWTWFSVMCTDGENACTPATYCRADQSCRKDASCTESCSPCTWGCNAGSGLCKPPPEPQIITWKVAPKLVQKNGTTGVFWNVLNVTSCTVSSTGGDSWTSGEGGISQGPKTSRPILARTVFTLHCTPYEGASWTDQTATVNIVPVFKEE